MIIDYIPVKWCVDGNHIVLDGINSVNNRECFPGEDFEFIIYTCLLHPEATMRSLWMVN